MPCSLLLGLCVQVEMETKEQQLQKEKVNTHCHLEHQKYFIYQELSYLVWVHGICLTRATGELVVVVIQFVVLFDI